MKNQKTYEITLNKISVRKITAAKAAGSDDFRLSVRDIEGHYSRSGGDPVWILANPAASGISPEKFADYVDKFRFHELNQVPIGIKYIKKFSKKFITAII